MLTFLLRSRVFLLIGVCLVDLYQYCYIVQHFGHSSYTIKSMRAEQITKNLKLTKKKNINQVLLVNYFVNILNHATPLKGDALIAEAIMEFALKRLISSRMVDHVLRCTFYQKNFTMYICQFYHTKSVRMLQFQLTCVRKQ